MLQMVLKCLKCHVSHRRDCVADPLPVTESLLEIMLSLELHVLSALFRLLASDESSLLPVKRSAVTLTRV